MAASRFSTCTRGATAVEFALIGVPLLLLIFGIVEFGRLMWTREALHHSAIAGARCMGMTQSACGTAGAYDVKMTQDYVVSQAGSWSVHLSTANITLNPAATCGGVTGFSQVTVAYTFQSLAPALISTLTGGRQLVATACFPNHA